MVDTLVLGTSAERREGSSPFIRTNRKSRSQKTGFFFCSVQALNLHGGFAAGKDTSVIGREARTRTGACTAHAAAKEALADSPFIPQLNS